MKECLNTLTTESKKGYVLIFSNPKNNDKIFLSALANIEDICYADVPYLPGTTKLEFAKYYSSIEDAKKDIYLLRYHHREFIPIKIILLYIDNCIVNMNLINNVKNYSLDELEVKEN